MNILESISLFTKYINANDISDTLNNAVLSAKWQYLGMESPEPWYSCLGLSGPLSIPSELTGLSIAQLKLLGKSITAIH